MAAAAMEGIERSAKNRKVGHGTSKGTAGSTIMSVTDLFRFLPPVSEPTMNAIRELGSSYITQDLARTIPPLLEGKDVIGMTRSTSFEKPLHVLIPAVELLYHFHFTPCDGTGVIVICPTSQIAKEMYSSATVLLKHHSLSHGLLIGGGGMIAFRGQAEQIKKGLNLLIATPCLLLRHLQKTDGFIYENLKCLMFHEADFMLRYRIDEEVLNRIIQILPKMRQTALFSCGWIEQFQFAVPLLFQKATHWFDLVYGRTWVINGGPQHGYCVVSSDKRLLGLYTFLERKRSKKVIVFFSSCKSVKFHSSLLQCIHMDCFAIHEEQEQHKWKSTVSDFCRAKKGILLCTAAAADDLDIPLVDWIVQYDPPDEPKGYVDRVSRKACAEVPRENTLLFLIPEELQFLRVFQAAKVSVRKFTYPIEKMKIMRHQLKKVVSENNDLHKSAEDAYRSYVSSYSLHAARDIFNFDQLDLKGIAASFCLSSPPAIIEHGQQQVQVQEEIRIKLEDFSMGSCEQPSPTHSPMEFPM